MLQDGVHAAFFFFSFSLPRKQTLKTDRGKNNLCRSCRYILHLYASRQGKCILISSATISTRKECFKSGQASHLSSLQVPVVSYQVGWFCTEARRTCTSWHLNDENHRRRAACRRSRPVLVTT